MRSRTVTCWMLIAVGGLAAIPAEAQVRSETHERYAALLWKYLHGADGPKYARWTLASRDLDLPAGPPSAPAAKTYLNAVAAAAAEELPYGSLLVTEHFAPGGARPVAVTVRYRFQPGYHPAGGDWYWAHYLPDGKVVRTLVDKAPHDKRGFAAYLRDDRLWVLPLGSQALADYLIQGELVQRVTRPGAGPGGLTVISDDGETLDAYLAAADGFETRLVDGRIWVFRPGSAELAEFEKSGELALHVTRPGAGPQGMTVKAADAATLDAYARATAVAP